MAVPDFQTLMRPILAALGDGHERSTEELRGVLAGEFRLSPEDLAVKLPSRRAKTFNNRVGWAITYLYRCGLLSRPRRSVYAITSRGRQVLDDHPRRVDLGVLGQFPELREFRRPRAHPAAPDDDERAEPPSTTPGDDAATPEERIAGAYRELRSALAEELRDRILEQPPSFLEHLVLDVLYAMGYGGSRSDAAERLGQSGDEGVDGVIREDKLGLDQIYVQAKRWAPDRTVGRPEIQRFVGALHGQQASRGVFITTSSFSSEAIEYAARITPRVILVDGRELAELMIDHGVGVAVEHRFETKRIDSDYFAEDARSD